MIQQKKGMGKGMLFGGNNKELVEHRIEEILCKKYNNYYRMAFSYTHNEADAADIVQEGAYKAIKNSGSLKKVEYAETWIYKIMMNEIYRFLGQKQKAIDRVEEIQEQGKEDQYINFDLIRAINEMPANDRIVIQLRFFEELSFEDISNILGENLNTIKSRLYRGLKKLRVDLTEEQ